MRHYAKGAGVLMFVAVAMMGCNTMPPTQEARQTLHDQCTAAITDFKAKDPGMDRFFDSAAGYAVLPSVGEGGIGLGGAFGRGEVYEHGKFIGHCSMTQGTVGAQLGGQSFAEIIFFKDKGNLDAFRSNQWAFDAEASAVAAAAGASATADYKKGVVVFTKAEGGLMVQAAIGGQKFNFISDVQTATERQ